MKSTEKNSLQQIYISIFSEEVTANIQLPPNGLLSYFASDDFVCSSLWRQ